MNDFFKEEEEIKKINFSIWKRLLSIILKKKKHVLFLGLFAVLLALVESLFPVLNAYAIETFIENSNLDTLTLYIVGNVIITIVFALSVFGFIYLGGIIESEVSYQLRKEAFNTLQKLPFSFYDKTPQGWIMSRMTSDTRRLSEIISWGVIDLVWSAGLMIFTLIILFLNSYILAIIVMIGVPFMLLIALFFRKKVLIQHRKARFYNSELTSQYSESFLGAKTTKSLAIEEGNLLEFNETARIMKRASIRANTLSSLFTVTLLMFCYIVVAVVIYSGSMLTIGNVLTISTLYLFIRSTMSFFDPILNMTGFISQLQQAQASAERILSLIETTPEIEDTKEVQEKYGTLLSHKMENWEDLHGKIEFKDVTFYYNNDEIILDKFNLKVEPGQSVALVGHTGSGKTTIINLISRFYEPKNGVILIDDKDYKERSISWLHKRLGYVLQSPHLFSTSIKENIRYGNLNATDDEIIKAAKAIGIHDYIMTLDKKYDTNVGEGGNLLSMGQKQLISFARAIIANPRILILDEATSSIDSQAEAIIQNATKTLLKDRTSFVVAHRLSTIVDCDLIVMLEMGKIIEQGTHQELLSKRGAYFELYKNQFFQDKTKEYDDKL